MTLAERMFRSLTDRQALFFEKLSSEAKEKLDQVTSKYARLNVSGPEGGIFFFIFQNGHLSLLNDPPQVNDNDMDHLILDGDGVNYPGGDEVLFDVIDGELSPRAAVSHHYFRVRTRKIIYDTEEFAQAFERFLHDMRNILRGGG